MLIPMQQNLVLHIHRLKWNSIACLSFSSHGGDWKCSHSTWISAAWIKIPTASVSWNSSIRIDPITIRLASLCPGLEIGVHKIGHSTKCKLVLFAHKRARTSIKRLDDLCVVWGHASNGNRVVLDSLWYQDLTATRPVHDFLRLCTRWSRWWSLLIEGPETRPCHHIRLKWIDFVVKTWRVMSSRGLWWWDRIRWRFQIGCNKCLRLC